MLIRNLLRETGRGDQELEKSNKLESIDRIQRDWRWLPNMQGESRGEGA